MYWIFLAIFIITVFIPDIIQGPILFLSETRAEELAIFLMGVIAILVFVKNERQLLIHKKEKEKDRKKISQTVKDLVNSYSYIGEVNRKMDLLMSIALGLSERSVLNQFKEEEIYQSIVTATKFLLKADFSTLRFVNTENLNTEKEIKMEEENIKIKNKKLIKLTTETNTEKAENCLIISSSQQLNKIKSYLLVCGYSKDEEQNPKNIEILKVFVSQALFLYSYTRQCKINK